MTGRLRDEWSVFLLAVQFLTRLPVPEDLPFSEQAMLRATRYYPLVGLLVGAIGAVVLCAAALLLPQPVAVLLSMAATLLATGAFHEDGLADAADGLGGGMTRARALEIMRDSRIGTYGMVTLGLVLALKAALLMALPTVDGTLALLVAHTLSRMTAVQIVFTDTYAREAGTKFVAPSIAGPDYRYALMTALLLLAVAVFWFGLVAAMLGLAVAAGLAALFRRMFLRKLNGYTGDCLGGVQQLFELGIYLGLMLWL